MTENDLRSIMSEAGWTWEIDAEISLLGADTIISSLYGDGSDLVSDGGWDENALRDIIVIARRRGFDVATFPDMI